MCIVMSYDIFLDCNIFTRQQFVVSQWRVVSQLLDHKLLSHSEEPC